MSRQSLALTYRAGYRIACAVAAMLIAACAAPPTDVADTGDPATVAPAAPTESGAAAGATVVDAPLPAEPVSPVAGAPLRLVLAPTGNEARYRVREQLARLPAPSDAVGSTGGVTGQIVINPDGSIVPDASTFVVDLTTLRSDSERRDGFVQRNTLQTDAYPTIEFVPATASGLPVPLPASGDVTFQLAGDLTLHGVTRPTTWDVTATVAGNEVSGTATTRFKFADFGLEIPSVMSVLSIVDDIQLELDFHLVPEPPAGA